jgi:CBS domain-containing membrane protein
VTQRPPGWPTAPAPAPSNARRLGLAVSRFLLALAAFGVMVALDRMLKAACSIDLLLASYGATAVVLVCAPTAEFARPRNVVAGHFIGASFGVACRLLLAPWSPELALVVSVSGAIALQTVLSSVHPPGGAVALFAVMAAEPFHPVSFVLVSATGGAAVFMACAWLLRAATRWVLDEEAA